jgi:hypothetical protein
VEVPELTPPRIESLEYWLTSPSGEVIVAESELVFAVVVVSVSTFVPSDVVTLEYS